MMHDREIVRQHDNPGARLAGKPIDGPLNVGRAVLQASAARPPSAPFENRNRSRIRNGAMASPTLGKATRADATVYLQFPQLPTFQRTHTRTATIRSVHPMPRSQAPSKQSTIRRSRKVSFARFASVAYLSLEGEASLPPSGQSAKRLPAITLPWPTQGGLEPFRW